VESNGHEPGTWLTIAQAAERAGVSADSVRRRLKRGQIPSRLVTTPYGPTWQVWLDPLPSSVAGDPPPADAYPPSIAIPTEGPPAAATLPGELEGGPLERLDRMQADLVAKAEAAAMWQARAEMLAGELADARGQLLALQAPQEEPTPESPPATVAVAEERPRAAWWRRVLLGE
jgi:hypothetical protein